MEITTIILTILASIAGGTPSLCDIVLTRADGAPISDSSGRTLGQYCQWSGPDAPVLNTEVCCDTSSSSAACWVASSSKRCEIGERYYCEYGNRLSNDGVVCHQPFPSACELGHCIEAPSTEPLTAMLETEGVLCCSAGGACFPVSPETAIDCVGDFVGCSIGVSNEDGTVDCLD